jgi:hypothetical protein
VSSDITKPRERILPVSPFSIVSAANPARFSTESKCILLIFDAAILTLRFFYLGEVRFFLLRFFIFNTILSGGQPLLFGYKTVHSLNASI